MSTTSISINKNDLPRRREVAVQHGVADRKKREKPGKLEELMFGMYRQILGTVLSTLLVGIFLLLYKISGLHAWWMQFVGNATNIH